MRSFFCKKPNLFCFCRVIIYELQFKTAKGENALDDKILKAIRDTLNGDNEAYSVIVVEYTAKLLATALYLTGSHSDAQDLTQETLIDGYIHLSKLREHDKIEGWLMRILKNKALNYLTRRHTTESEDAIRNASTKQTPEAAYLRRESLDEWHLRLDSLSPKLKESAKLYFWHDLTMEDIANRLKIPLGTVKRRIHDARVILRKEYKMDTYRSLTSEELAELITKKIEELANYEKLYGSKDGFDAAYNDTLDMIRVVADKDERRKLAFKSTDIALKTDKKKYKEEVFKVYKENSDVVSASRHYLDICWAMGENHTQKLEYTIKTIIPALLSYPDTKKRAREIGYHYFWLFYYESEAGKFTNESIDCCEKYLNKAFELYKQSGEVDAMYGAVIAGIKSLEYMRDANTSKAFSVTGETWSIKDERASYCSQPGFGYGFSLNRYITPVFYYAAGCGGDYFLPQAEHIEAGLTEELRNRHSGKVCGSCEVISTDETVETPAGTFDGCLHIKRSVLQWGVTDVWYKDGVGLVRIVIADDCRQTKVLESYEIKGGSGYIPTALGNKWVYVTPDRPDEVFERNEYVIEQKNDEYVSLSCLNFAAIKGDANGEPSPMVLFCKTAEYCDNKQYPEAADALRKIVIGNSDRESVDAALAYLECLEEKLRYDAKKWRFCPSSMCMINVKVDGGRINHSYSADYPVLDLGPWGTRGAENRIFGVKTMRYLELLAGTFWDDRWVPGYADEYSVPELPDIRIKLTVDDGGRIETPAGVFDETVHVTFDVDGEKEHFTDYFYSHVECGLKEYWFAKGVGVVRFKCTWGNALDSDALLTEYRTVASEGEYYPIHIGNHWRYEEQKLTNEGYIARSDQRILSGRDGRYLMAAHQMFTFKGDVDAYNAFKESLKK